MAWARKRRRDGERGSVLVEMAMVVLPLMTILLGMVEIGGMWRDKSTVVQASRQGARVLSTSSIAPTDDADREALLAVLAGVPEGNSGASSIEVRKVIIFNPASAHPEAASGSTLETNWNQCANIGESGDISVLPRSNNVGIGVSNRCNVYLGGNDDSRNSLDTTLGGTGIDDVTNFGAGGWNQQYYGHSQANPQNLPEIGVYVEIYRPWVTGFFPGDGQTISGYTIMTVEPASL